MMASGTPSEATAEAQQAWRRLLGGVLLGAALLGAGLLWHHRADIDAYRRYFVDERPVASPRFDALSASMDEAALQQHFAGLPLRCISEPRERNTLGDRVCWADISRIDAVPAMQLKAFFDQGRLAYMAIDLPWWAHHAALSQVVAQFGGPEGMNLPPAAERVVQWRTRSGRLKLERDPGYDPLRTIALQWRADAPAPFSTPAKP